MLLEMLSEAGDSEGSPIRCPARTLTPGSTALAEHPTTVNVREDALLERLNSWIGGLFDRDHVDQTVAAMVASADNGTASGEQASAKQRLADAEARLRRHQAALEAGVDPAGLVDAMNEAQREREAARTALQATPERSGVTAAEAYAMIDSLGDVGDRLGAAKPTGLARLYEELRLEMRYEPGERAVDVTLSPRVANECVRGGICTLTTRLTLRPDVAWPSQRLS